ncbi:MAG: DUF1501 domain-containing protein [Candidatus Rokuibacteriota bacterium]
MRPREALEGITRRHFFHRSACGIGTIALASLLNESLFAGERDAADPLAPRPPHFAPKAKRIIYLFMAGAPSQLDLFDWKPKLGQRSGQPVPSEIIKHERFAFIRGTPKLLGSPYPFRQHGRSGATVSSLLPHLTRVVDDLAIVKSVHTEHFNHAPAQIFVNTGHQIIGRPSMGAWLTYGLGSESRDLPGFVVLLSGQKDPGGGSACWSSGFLPTTYQGVELRAQGDPVLSLSNPAGMTPELRRRSLDTLRSLNEDRLREMGDPEIAARIAAYEIAYRMQTSVPELADVSTEPRHIHELYGTEAGVASFANNCLLARRLVERGARFVQLYHRGWDHHGTRSDNDLVTALPRLCRETDRAAAALITDLKQRGLLDETLVIWGGEFGRTPMNEERNGSTFLGRDHHIRAFTMWMAGGGVTPGITLGETDDLGYAIVKDPVHVHDLHATILRLMGLDHTRLTYRFQGRDHRLTDVRGKVVQKLLA